jgi:cytochrome c556
MMKRSAKLICAGALFALQAVTGASADSADAIDYRQHIMKALNEQAGALGEILSGAVPDDNVLAHLDALALTASTALKAFEAKVPGGEADRTSGRTGRTFRGA